MPYEMKVDGMVEISELLEKLEEKAPAVAAQALYEGAAVMQKAILKEMASIKTAPFEYARPGETRLPSPEEKEVLEHAGVGVAKFDKNGTEIDTSVGFNNNGYVSVKWNHMSSKARTNYKAVSKRGGSGVTASSVAKKLGVGSNSDNLKPVGVVANAINSGTSFMVKQPFVRKGASKGAPQAMAVMREKIEREFEKIINNK